MRRAHIALFLAAPQRGGVGSARPTLPAAAYKIAIDYCTQLTLGKPWVSVQIVQDGLVKVLAEVYSMQLHCLRLCRLMGGGSARRHDRCHRQDE